MPQTLTIIKELSCKSIDEVEHQLFTLEQVLDHNIVSHFQPLLNLESLIRNDRLNSEEKSKLLKLCYQFNEIFHKSNAKSIVTDQVQHHIRTTANIPTHPQIYKHPQIHKELVKTNNRSIFRRRCNKTFSKPVRSPNLDS